VRAAAQAQLNTRGKSFPGLICLQDLQMQRRQTPHWRADQSLCSCLGVLSPRFAGGRDAAVTSRLSPPASGCADMPSQNASARMTSWHEAFLRRSRGAGTPPTLPQPLQVLPADSPWGSQPGRAARITGAAGERHRGATQASPAHVLLLSFGFAPAVPGHHAASSARVNCGLVGLTKPSASCRVGRSPRAQHPPRSGADEGHVPCPSAGMGFTTAPSCRELQDLSRETQFDNAALPRKAKHNAANHCSNKQQNSSLSCSQTRSSKNKNSNEGKVGVAI